MTAQEVQKQTETAVLEKKSDLELLLSKEFRYDKDNQKDEKKKTVETALSILADFVLKDVNLVSDSAVKSIESVIAQIDKILTEQVNEILHNEEFQKLEGAWRGLHYLVTNTETEEQLKIKVMDVSKAELAKTLKKYEGVAWDQSPLFKKIYGEEYDQFGGHPYGCLVGDYHFDHTPADVKLLAQIAEVSAAAHSPFITGLSPATLQMESWSELSNPRDLTKIFSTAEYAAWRSLRESDDAKYLALALPRFLARQPYGAKTNPVDGFAFEEFDDRLDESDFDSPEAFKAAKEAKRNDLAKLGADSKNYTWANSAYAMAVNINRSFKEYGWCSRIRGIQSGGEVKGLPVHTFPSDDGGVDAKCPTEIAIGDRREAELAKNGFMPLVHKKNTDIAAFIGAQTLYKPKEFDNPAATANENLSARLPYIFATCRFAHYLKGMIRDWVGENKTRDQLQRELNEWINNYVDTDPANSAEEYQRTHPLAAAEVVVEEDEENPGYYKSKFYLRPHYQLEGLTASLRLVSKLPQKSA